MHLSEIQREEVKDSEIYFPDVKQDALYLSIALGGETGEILNKVKKYYRNGWSMEQLRETIADELADVLIYLVMFADFIGVDLEEEWIKKKEFNDDRYLPGRAVTRSERLPTTPE